MSHPSVKIERLAKQKEMRIVIKMERLREKFRIAKLRAIQDKNPQRNLLAELNASVVEV